MNSRLLLITFWLLTLLTLSLKAQVNSFELDIDMESNDILDVSGLVIGADTINDLAALEINSSSKGFLLPRLSMQDRNTMTGIKPAGLQIFNTTTKCLDTWSGVEWITQCGSLGPNGGVNPDSVDVTLMGSTESQYSNDIEVESSGNYFIIGEFQDSMDIDKDGIFELYASSAYLHNYFVAKFDNSDNLIWIKDADDTGASYGRWVKIDSNGDVIISGSFTDQMDFDKDGNYDVTSFNYQDVFFAKLDGSTGDLIWVKSIAGAYYDYVNDMDLDNSDDIFLTGTYQDSCDFNQDGIFEKMALGSSDIYLAKYDAGNGALIWVNSMGGTTSDGVSGLATDNSNNVIVLGTFKNGADFDEDGIDDLVSSGISSDAFIAKYSGSTGNLINLNHIDGTGIINTNKIFIDSNNRFYITGQMTNTVDFDNDGNYDILSTGSYDAYVARFLPNMTLSWAKNFGGYDVANTNDVIGDNNGNVYILGTWESNIEFGVYAGFESQPYDIPDIFILKLGEYQGVVKSVFTLHGSGYDYPKSLAFKGNSLYATGYTPSPILKYGDKQVLNLLNAYEIYVIKI